MLQGDTAKTVKYIGSTLADDGEIDSTVGWKKIFGALSDSDRRIVKKLNAHEKVGGRTNGANV